MAAPTQSERKKAVRFWRPHLLGHAPAHRVALASVPLFGAETASPRSLLARHERSDSVFLFRPPRPHASAARDHAALAAFFFWLQRLVIKGKEYGTVGWHEREIQQQGEAVNHLFESIHSLPESDEVISVTLLDELAAKGACHL